MSSLKIPTEIILAMCFAGLLAGAAMAEIGADPNRTPANPAPSTEAAPVTPQNRTGLPPAPAEKIGPGVGSRALTGNDVTPSPTPGPNKPSTPEPVK